MSAAHASTDHRLRPHQLDELTPREREVLALMAEGRSNVAIGEALFIGLKTVEAHVGSVFTKLGLTEDTSANRRVLAVLAFLQPRPASSAPAERPHTRTLDNNSRKGGIAA